MDFGLARADSGTRGRDTWTQERLKRKKMQTKDHAVPETLFDEKEKALLGIATKGGEQLLPCVFAVGCALLPLFLPRTPACARIRCCYRTRQLPGLGQALRYTPGCRPSPGL